MASVVKVEGWWRSMANHDSPSFIGQDVREVRVEGLVLVLLVEAHLEGPDLEPVVAVPATAVAVAVAAAGVVAADEAPPELGALMDVGHLLALLHAEHHALGLVDAADPEALHVGVDPGGEVPDAGEEQVPHLVRHQLVHDAAHQHRRRRQGRRRGDGPLVRLDGLVVGRHGWLVVLLLLALADRSVTRRL
uniref:Uncharacterized protein n=1 Tax=Oryza meridionalis TaxID=40149 RepID=A0A0E0C4F5_9ORYZ